MQHVVGAKYGIGYRRQQAVRDNDLLKKTNRDQPKPPVQLLWSCYARRCELWQQMRWANDRAGNKLREKRNKQCEVQKRPGWFSSPVVDIERVGHGLECVKGNSDRQYDAPFRWLVVDPRRCRKHDEVIQQEATVFKIAKQAKVDDDANGQQHSASLLDLFGKNLLRDMPVDNGRYPQQNHERWIPRRIKQIAGNQQIGFFCFPAERRVVQRQHQDEKHDKRQ